VAQLIEKSAFFKPNELAKLDRSHMPHHIAIIPDGNRRWAKGNHKDVKEGYREGAEVLINIVKAAKELGIKALTVFSFSTENWARPPAEIEALLRLICEYLKNCQQMMLDLGVRINVIGDIRKMPKSLTSLLQETQELTKDCHNLDLILAMNYGSRDEIKRAVEKILEECLHGNVSLEALSEDKINTYLDTSPWPDPDLIIRTSGEKRVSNFLLWQSSYAEIYTEDVNWPNFTPNHFLNAIVDYQQRNRRRGGG